MMHNSKVLRCDTFYEGSQYYLPPSMGYTAFTAPATVHRHALAGTYCTYPQRDGQAELTSMAGCINLSAPGLEAVYSDPSQYQLVPTSNNLGDVTTKPSCDYELWYQIVLRMDSQREDVQVNVVFG